MIDVLIDTSVWRRYFSGGRGVDALDDVLREGRARAHAWVIGELMLGGISATAEKTLRELPTAPVVAEADVHELIRARKLQQRGIGWVDAQLLASALVGRTSLWTLDAGLAVVAGRLGIAFT